MVRDQPTDPELPALVDLASALKVATEVALELPVTAVNVPEQALPGLLTVQV